MCGEAITRRWTIMETICDPVEILLVGDNPGDVRLTQEVLRVLRSIEDFWLTIVKLPRGEYDGR